MTAPNATLLVLAARGGTPCGFAPEQWRAFLALHRQAEDERELGIDGTLPSLRKRRLGLVALMRFYGVRDRLGLARVAESLRAFDERTNDAAGHARRYRVRALLERFLGLGRGDLEEWAAGYHAPPGRRSTQATVAPLRPPADGSEDYREVIPPEIARRIIRARAIPEIVTE